MTSPRTRWLRPLLEVLGALAALATIAALALQLFSSDDVEKVKARSTTTTTTEPPDFIPLRATVVPFSDNNYIRAVSTQPRWETRDQADVYLAEMVKAPPAITTVTLTLEGVGERTAAVLAVDAVVEQRTRDDGYIFSPPSQGDGPFRTVGFDLDESDVPPARVVTSDTEHLDFGGESLVAPITVRTGEIETLHLVAQARRERVSWAVRIRGTYDGHTFTLEIKGPGGKPFVTAASGDCDRFYGVNYRWLYGAPATTEPPYLRGCGAS